MNLEAEIISILRNLGADFVFFTEIAQLSNSLSSHYPRAIVVGIALSPGYIHRLSQSHQLPADEFNETERKTDHLADFLAAFLDEKGYTAFSQSEKNLMAKNCYDESTKSSILPHKTIAGLAGLGWIGKHNLLVSSQYGSALSICTVLTDAPLETATYPPASPDCGDCNICRDICQAGALKGNNWREKGSRDELLEVSRCTACLKCLALCPWTQNYMNQHLTSQGESPPG